MQTRSKITHEMSAAVPAKKGKENAKCLLSGSTPAKSSTDIPEKKQKSEGKVRTRSQSKSCVQRTTKSDISVVVKDMQQQKSTPSVNAPAKKGKENAKCLLSGSTPAKSSTDIPEKKQKSEGVVRTRSQSKSCLERITKPDISVVVKDMQYQKSTPIVNAPAKKSKIMVSNDKCSSDTTKMQTRSKKAIQTDVGFEVKNILVPPKQKVTAIPISSSQNGKVSRKPRQPEKKNCLAPAYSSVKRFAVGELCFGQVRGYPAWPALITKVEKSFALVKFFNSAQSGKCFFSKMYDLEESVRFLGLHQNNQQLQKAKKELAVVLREKLHQESISLKSNVICKYLSLI